MEFYLKWIQKLTFRFFTTPYCSLFRPLVSFHKFFLGMNKTSIYLRVLRSSDWISWVKHDQVDLKLNIIDYAFNHSHFPAPYFLMYA